VADVVASRRVGVSALERVEALITNPALYAAATAVPERQPGEGGRPRQFPVFMWLLFDALLSVYGSGRRVESELAHPVVWSRIREVVADQFPNDPSMWVGDRPMRRHHYLYGRTTYLTQPEILDEIADIHRTYAAQQARGVGLLDPDGAGSWTHPELSRVMYADGKVVTPLFKAQPGTKIVNKTTGEVRYPRAEHDAALHWEGTGETAWGCKYVIIAARGTQPNSRIILDADYVATPGGEAATAVTMFSRLAELTPGAQAVIYDGALRGVHHQTFLRDLGMLTVNRVTAQTGVRNKSNVTRKRVEKLVFVETKTVTTNNVPTDLQLFSRGGQIGLKDLTDTGEETFVVLDRVRTHRNPDKSGRYRWYNDYRLPVDHGGGTITVRLHSNDDDMRRKFNRTENVRPIPPGDADFARLYPRRNDAESINRHLDDTLWLRRAHTIGHRRQRLNILTYALGINSLTRHLHCAQAPPAAA